MDPTRWHPYAAAATLLLLSAIDAAASGFAARENSAVGLGMAFAGAGSRADDLSIIFNNPAGMTRLDGNQVQFGLTGGFPTADFHGTPNESGVPIPGNNGNNGGRMGALPDFYALYSASDRLKFGLAITVPFGNTIKYNSAWYGRSLGINSSVLTGDINP